MGLHTDAVKRKIRMLCVVFLCVVLSAEAMLQDAGADEGKRNPGGDTLSVEAGEMETDTSTDEGQRSLGEYTPPAELCHVETEAVQIENELIFGNLAIELPEGVYARIEATDDTSQNGRQTISLEGAEEFVGNPEDYNSTGPFPPEISIAHYTAEYESGEALICALLSLFSGGNLRVLYEDDKNDTYIFQMEGESSGDQYKTYCFALIRDKDIYLVSEFYMEKNYSFSALWKQGKVKWQDTGRAIKYDDSFDFTYFKIAPEQGMSFLCYDIRSSKEVYFYLEGYYDSCYASYETGRYGGIYNEDLTDVNCDGFLDIDYGNSVLIWDSEGKEFINVEYPKDMPDEYVRESIPGTNIIWGYQDDYLTDTYSSRDTDYMDYVETLWQWEGFTPVKKRECRAEIRGDEVRVFAYEDTADHILFDESFMREEWDDDDSGNVRALYRRFYDGLAPLGYFFPDEDGGQEGIPQGLLDMLSDAILDGKDSETLQAMWAFTELRSEECYEAAVENDDIRVNMLRAWQYGDFDLRRADIDNDGIEDILGRFYEGGSGGFVSYVLFQGQADGTYVETDSFRSVWEPFSIISYDGKNYLVRMLYDYGSKYYNGLCVAVFEEGIYTEEAKLMLYAGDYELAIGDFEEEYEASAVRVMEMAVSYDRLVGDNKVILGSAEEPAEDNEEYPYMCDLDNDGEMEYYDKHIWTSSNTYTWDLLSFTWQEDEGAALIDGAILERVRRGNSYRDMMLWADEADGETVVNVLYRKSLMDFAIIGYVVDGSTCRQVYEITADAVQGVRQTRYPRSAHGDDHGESGHLNHIG